MSGPIFPPTLPESHRAIAQYHAVLSQYEAAALALRNEIAWLRRANEEARSEWQVSLAATDAALTRAEAAESLMRTLERGARLCDRTLSVSPSKSITLQIVYEFGSLCLMKLAHVPAPPHPRLLLDEIVDKRLAAPVHDGDPESGVDHEDATVIAAGVVVAAMCKDCCGNEAAAYSRQCNNEGHGKRVGSGGAGAGAGR
jgi:hypothetical protein